MRLMLPQSLAQKLHSKTSHHFHHRPPTQAKVPKPSTNPFKLFEIHVEAESTPDMSYKNNINK